MSSVTITPALLQSVRDAVGEVRSAAPLVQCVTNSVVVNFTANALLAIGASPAMVDIPEESGVFASVADAVLINLGTPNAEQRAASVEAVAAARAGGTPWVLDPVAVGVLPVRTALAHRLLDERPSIVRGNPSEILALAGAGAGGRGVDSADGVDDALEGALSLARSTGAVIAVSGAVDLLTDGERVVRIANGDPLLTRITGGGCALGAVLAAFAGAHHDRFEASVAAVAAYTVAAELAARGADGPGSFAVGFLDALASLDGATVAERIVLS